MSSGGSDEHLEHVGQRIDELLWQLGGCGGVLVDRDQRVDLVRERRLAADVMSGEYRPSPLRTYRRAVGGKDRLFAVSAVRDRVLQQAAREVLRPWLDDRQADSSFAYLRGRGWLDALSEVEGGRDAGLRYVYRFDIRQYFESIDHESLGQCIFDAVGSVEVTALLLSWVACPLVRGNTVRHPSQGVALGMPISPTLANHYLVDFDRAVSAHAGRFVRYADDGCVLCPTAADAEVAEGIVRELLRALGLSANPVKSRRTSFDEGFSFLGFTFNHDHARPEVRSQFAGPFSRA